MEMTGHSCIAGVGAYVPLQVVSSEELMDEVHSEKLFGIPNTWLAKATGIKERRCSLPTEIPSVLAIKAAEAALTDSGIDPLEIGKIIFCGIERDYQEPSTAHFIQYELGHEVNTSLYISCTSTIFLIVLVYSENEYELFKLMSMIPYTRQRTSYIRFQKPIMDVSFHYKEAKNIKSLTLKTSMKKLENVIIEFVLEQSGGNQSRAAKRLGVSESTLSRRLKVR